MDITLIGMPGSGKSFVGKKLAERLGFLFIEIDKVIEQEYGLSLQEVVEKLGNEKFLDTEAEATIKSIETQNGLVVSPGGSVVYRQNAMDHLKKISKVLYLKVPLDVLEKRIGNSPRGIVMAEGKTFADLYAERIPLYEKFADYTINGNADPDIVVMTILSLLDPSIMAAQPH